LILASAQRCNHYITRIVLANTVHCIGSPIHGFSKQFIILAGKYNTITFYCPHDQYTVFRSNVLYWRANNTNMAPLDNLWEWYLHRIFFLCIVLGQAIHIKNNLVLYWQPNTIIIHGIGATNQDNTCCYMLRVLQWLHCCSV
jgi:hypothetical protein